MVQVLLIARSSDRYRVVVIHRRAFDVHTDPLGRAIGFVAASTRRFTLSIVPHKVITSPPQFILTAFIEASSIITAVSAHLLYLLAHIVSILGRKRLLSLSIFSVLVLPTLYGLHVDMRFMIILSQQRLFIVCYEIFMHLISNAHVCVSSLGALALR